MIQSYAAFGLLVVLIGLTADATVLGNTKFENWFRFISGMEQQGCAKPGSGDSCDSGVGGGIQASISSQAAEFLEDSFEIAPAVGRITLPPEAPGEEAFFKMLKYSIGKWLLSEFSAQVEDLIKRAPSNAASPKSNAVSPVVELDEDGLRRAEASNSLGMDYVVEKPNGGVDRETRIALKALLQQGVSGKRSWRELKEFMNRENLTVILRDADGRHPYLARLRESIAQQLGLQVGISLYYTPPGSKSGVAPHVDSMDVIAIQVSGSKEWSIDPTLRPVPLLDQVPRLEKVNAVRCQCARYDVDPLRDGQGNPTGRRSSATPCTAVAKRFLSTRSDETKRSATTCRLVTVEGSEVSTAPNVLYIPRGFIHNTTAKALPLAGGPASKGASLSGSVHISIGIESTPHKTVAAFLDYALTLSGPRSSTSLWSGTIDVAQTRAFAIPSASSLETSQRWRELCLTSSTLLRVVFSQLTRLPPFASFRRGVPLLSPELSTALLKYYESHSDNKERPTTDSTERPAIATPALGSSSYLLLQLRGGRIILEQQFLSKKDATSQTPNVKWCSVMKALNERSAWMDSLHLWYKVGYDKCDSPESLAPRLSSTWSAVFESGAAGTDAGCGELIESRWLWNTARQLMLNVESMLESDPTLFLDWWKVASAAESEEVSGIVEWAHANMALWRLRSKEWV